MQSILRSIDKSITVILLMNPIFEYDPDKSQKNEARHGIDFEWAQELWKTRHVIVPAKKVRGEYRHFILARIDDRLYVAVFTRRGTAVRLISCHKADKRLERIYEEGSHEKEKG